MNRHCFWAVTASCLLAPLSSGDEPKKTARTEFFQATKIWPMHITVSAEEFKAMQPANRGGFPGFGGPPAPPPKKAEDGREFHRNVFNVDIPKSFGSFESGGQTFAKVGIRYKGNGTLMDSMRVTKKPFKIELDKFDSKNRFHDLKTLNLNNGITDPSKARETLSYAAYRDAGVPAPLTTLAELTLTVPGKFDKELLGMYTIVEPLDKTFLKAHFQDDKGLLMKPERMGGLNYIGDDWERYKPNFQPKRDATPEEAKRVIAFVKLVNQGPDDQFRKEIESYLDVDAFLRYMAVTSLIVNADSFFLLGHNFDLYLHSATNKFHFIPWDTDRAFANFPVFGTPEQLLDLSLTKPYAQCRLPDRLMAIPEYAERYKKILKEVLPTFAKEKMLKRIGEFEAATKEMLEKDTQAAGGRKEETIGGVFGKIPDLRTFMDKRTESIAAQMEGKSKGFSPQGFGRPAGPPPGQPGMLIPTPVQDALRLTEEQKKQIAEIQKEADAKLDKVLNEDQRAAYKRIREGGGPPMKK